MILTYQLRDITDRTSREKLSDTGITNLRTALGTWTHNSIAPASPYILAHVLEHQYSPLSLAFENLKGIDALRATALRSVAIPLGITLYTALVEHVSRGARYPALLYDDNTACSLIQIRSNDGQLTLGDEINPYSAKVGNQPALSVFAIEIIQPHSFASKQDAKGKNTPAGQSYLAPADR